MLVCVIAVEELENPSPTIPQPYVLTVCKICHFDSHTVETRIVLPIEMHNDFEIEHVVHREQLPV